jgi:hypothetical protein
VDYLVEGAVSLECVAAVWAVDEHDGWVAMDLELGADGGEAGAVNSAYSDWGVVEGLGHVVEYWF